MVKNFYKRIAEPKTFFDPCVKIRTYAFGEKVRRDFIAWQDYFFKEKGIGTGRLIISPDEHIYGSEYAKGGLKEGRAAPISSGGLCHLIISGVRYELGADGWVTAGGRRTALYAGVETKAWAIATVPTRREFKNMLFILGKPKDGGHMMLSGYAMTRGGIDAHPTFSVEYESSLDRESYITCLGSHIFTVHNSNLDYRYWNVATGELEVVPIGEDCENAESSWCRRVSRGIVCNREGQVFWLSDGEIYGITVGAPAKLLRIDPGADEITVGIRGGERGLSVYRKNKNTDKQTLAAYVENGGSFRIISAEYVK